MDRKPTTHSAVGPRSARSGQPRSFISRSFRSLSSGSCQYLTNRRPRHVLESRLIYVWPIQAAIRLSDKPSLSEVGNTTAESTAGGGVKDERLLDLQATTEGGLPSLVVQQLGGRSKASSGCREDDWAAANTKNPATFHSVYSGYATLWDSPL